MDVFTIGFTKKNAKSFFGYLKDAKIKTLIDVRLNNVSQLAGFAKKDDLKYFLNEICNAEYVHIPELAPTKEMLNSYKKGIITWESYEDKFLNLLAMRSIEKSMDINQLENSCLLCSEHEPHFCHRRLVVEYLNLNLNLNINVRHIY